MKSPPLPPSDDFDPALQCAVEVLDTLPPLMASLRCELRRDEETPLTMVQFHTVTFLDREGASSLSQIAKHLGLGLPTASKVIDGLVHATMVERRSDPGDRRRLSVELTPCGRQALADTRQRAQKHLARFLAPLSRTDRNQLVEAMRSMRALFPPNLPQPCPKK